ncbi:MAG: glycosyltransferase, partial [Candidatus Niameybacter stercoravium]|nr:glycosyltransferase [Candidatus Niameybacter stercoravium]
PITASHWKEELDTFKPEVLFVESAWHGKDHSCEQKIACYKQECSEELKELIQYCKQQGIKTVFWNKEGLVNFEYFKSASALFETVFVTDERMIEEQKQLCGHERVYILPFAAQPKLHNSINKHAYYLGEIAFAGNWYGDKHPRRLVDMQNILEPALEFDLDIYDRSYERRKELIQVGYYWPYPYRSSIVGGVSYEIMTQLYKYYHMFLNVNSVQDSKWMIARRVYEIMATKTVVVSGYALSIETQMKDYIYYSQSEEETRKILSFLIDHPILRDQKGKKAQRYILENHTYEKRLERILRTIGLPYEIRIKPMVSIIVWIESLEELCSLYSQVKRQSYEKIQLKVFYSTANKELEDLKFDQENIELCPVQPKNLVQAILSQCTKKFFGEYMTIMCSEYIYGEHYIRDYVNTFEYIEADIIGKSTVFYYRVSTQNLYKVNYGVGEDCYCEGVIPGSWMVKCKALTYEMLEVLLKADTIRNYMNRLGEKKYRIYSDDAFNICLLGEDIPMEAEFIAHTPNYRLIIEI